MMLEYANSWTSPRFWFKPNIGDVVGDLSLSHGLALVEYTQRLSFFSSVGSFCVAGPYEDIKLFGQRLERDFGQYLTLNNTDWDYYAQTIE